MGEPEEIQDAATRANAFVSTLMRRIFCPIVLFSQVWGIVAISLSITWMRNTSGFGWTKGNVFSYHPVLLATGMVYLNGQGILIYRLFRTKPKKILKYSHAVIQLTLFAITCVGLQSAFDHHNWNGIPNLYSLHSWIGLALVICFSAQLLFGFLVFLLPYASIRLRIISMPFHRVFGLIMFGVAGATAVMGITEKAIFGSQACWSKRDCNLADIINWMGLSILLYVISILCLVATPEYRRVPLASD